MAEITLAAYTDAREFGGAERSLATLLAELDSAFRVTLLATDRDVAEAVVSGRPGTAVEILPAVRNKFDVSATRAHLAAVRRLRPRLLHANLWWSWTGQYGVAAGLATRGVRVVVVEHGAVSPAADPLQLGIKRMLARGFAAHVSVGQLSARALERALRLPEHSVRTIHNGVVDRPPPPAAAGRPDGAAVIGAVGRLSPEKGFDVLLRALPELSGTRLVLVGDGSERGRLERLARDLGVANRVEITGWVNDARSHLPSFDLFVLPSRLESFPLAVVEAMLAERAVVAAQIGSIPEAVIHGETGMVVPPDEPHSLAAAIAELLASPDRRAQMGRNARKLALEQFSAPAMARSYEHLYREVLAGR
jgi:glycosyltransferase involved in cell wall biosynthesis